MKYSIIITILSVLVASLIPTKSEQPSHPYHVYADPELKEHLQLDIKPIEPIEKTVWAVSSNVGGVDKNQINKVLRILQDKGLTKQGAAMLTGNFITESRLIPCGLKGDGGLAEGLAQWHPNRRRDMPCDLTEQLHWAIDTEMVRDTPALAKALYKPSATVKELDHLLYRWERYGIKGNRYELGVQILKEM